MRRDLSTLDRDIGQDWSRIIQEAFKHGIDCDIIFGGLLAGGVVQDIHAVSSTQNYVLGTHLRTPDGRIFYYAKCNAERTTAFAMMHNRKAGPDIARATNLTIKPDVGATHLFVTVAGGDGQGSDGAIGKDALVGGYLVIFGDNNLRENRLIKGNTLVGAGGGTIDLEIDRGVTAEHPITITLGVEVWGNIYDGVAMLAEDYLTVAGFPAVTVIPMINKYFWLQTWGPVRISAQNFNLGKNAGERMCVFGPDGSIRTHEMNGIGANDRQHAGFIIPRTSASVGTSPLLMLQIRP